MDTSGDHIVELLADLGSFALRPRAWLRWAFPWGEVGTELEKRTGPSRGRTRALPISSAGC